MEADRYSKIVKWARRRYSNADGSVTLSVAGFASPFVRIKHAAWVRYM